LRPFGREWIGWRRKYVATREHRRKRDATQADRTLLQKVPARHGSDMIEVWVHKLGSPPPHTVSTYYSGYSWNADPEKFRVAYTYPQASGAADNAKMTPDPWPGEKSFSP
jgi:hypothetical protein